MMVHCISWCYKKMNVINFYNRILKKLRKIFKHIVVSYDSKLLVSKVKNKKGLFIDCGTNLGQDFSHFSKYYKLSNYDYVMIEPNPNCINLLKEKYADNIQNKQIVIIPKAATAKDGFLKLYGLSEKSESDSIYNPTGPDINSFSQGASVLKEHNSLFYESENQSAIVVETFRFSDYLIKQADLYETIVIKIDIEGAEYELINDMIETNSIFIPKIIYAEFHSHFMNTTSREKYKKIETTFLKFIKRTDVKFRPWN